MVLWYYFGTSPKCISQGRLNRCVCCVRMSCVLCACIPDPRPLEGDTLSAQITRFTRQRHRYPHASTGRVPVSQTVGLRPKPWCGCSFPPFLVLWYYFGTSPKCISQEYPNCCVCCVCMSCILCACTCMPLHVSHDYQDYGCKCLWMDALSVAVPCTWCADGHTLCFPVRRALSTMMAMGSR